VQARRAIELPILVAASTVDTSWDQFKIAAPH